MPQCVSVNYGTGEKGCNALFGRLNSTWECVGYVNLAPDTVQEIFAFHVKIDSGNLSELQQGE